MADNFVANAGAGGDTFGADDIGGTKFPRSKIIIGADGVNDGDVSTANPLPVGDAGGSLTIDGTVTANAGTGPWPVTDNGGALTVDGTVSLGAGAASIGTLAANSGVDIGDVDVTSVLPGTGATNLGKAEDAVHGSGDVGVMVLGVRNDAGTAMAADGDYIPLSVNGSGALRVTPGNVAVAGLAATDAAVSGNPVYVAGRASAAVPSDVSADGDVVPPWMLRSGAQATVVTAAGALIGGDAANGLDADVTRVIPGTSATHLGKAEDAAHTSGDTGVYALAVRDTAPAAHSGTDGDYESLHVNDEGGLWTTPTGSANGGTTLFRSIDLDETEEEVKATAGTVYGMWVTNTATATRWIKFYNATAANVTVGTTTPVLTIGIPGNSSDDVSGAFNTGAVGVAFATAITVAATTAVADNDTGAPAANDVIVNIFYK